MTLSTFSYLDSTNINDLARAYSLAYLRKKKVKINKSESEIDNNWNVGKFEEGYLLRAEDDSIFTLFNFPEIVDQKLATERQVVGSNLHENFVNIISHFIATGKNALPSNNMKIGMCINHHNTHWTLLLAEFSNINQAEYKTLFNAYQKHAKTTKENQYEDGSAKPINIIRNNVVNFVKKNKKITFNGNADPRGNGLGNNQLPLKVGEITLNHFDSLGKRTTYASNVAKSMSTFTKKHKAKFSQMDCQRQSGNTCGDWSVYNAFQYGLLEPKKQHPTSANLRHFFNNKDVSNAHQILFTAKPKLKKIAKKDQICITENAQKLDDNYVAVFKDFGSKSGSLVGRTFLGLVSGAIFYAAMALVFVNPLLPIAGALVSGLTVSTLLYKRLTELFFGQKTVVLEKKNGKPVVKDKLEHRGLGDFIGVHMPYQKDLESLEKDIESLITEDDAMTDKQKIELLTHQFAKKIIESNPSFFSDQDKAVVKLDGYAHKLGR
jgi:hypothetical protein